MIAARRLLSSAVALEAVADALDEAPRAPARQRPDWVLLFVLVAGAWLLLANLGETYLWTDECEAACLAESILEHGLPLAFDGRNYTTQWVVAKREDFNDDLVWVLSPWLQLYVCAGSFALFGVSTFAARLPFALAGLACLPMIYALARRVTGDRRVARAAALLLLTCIPFLLHSRQARYYPVAMFATLWAVHAYVGVLERRRFSTPQLVAAVAVLFHSNYGLCVPLVGALCLHAPFYAFGRVRLWQVGVVPLAIGALTLPWAIYAKIHRTASRFDLSEYFHHLYNYLFAVNRWALPLPLVLVVLVLLALGWRSKRISLARPGVGASALAGVVGVVFVSTNVGLFTRYVVNVIPLFVFLCALLIVWLADCLRERMGARAGALALALVPLSMFTTVLAWPAASLLAGLASSAPHKVYMDNEGVRRPLAHFTGAGHEIFDLFHELTHDYDGPLEGVSDFLRRNARSEHTVFIDYGDLPLSFYTDLKVRGGLQGIPYHGRPEWIVSRSNRVGVAVNELREFAAAEGYVPIVLPLHPDTRWENREDPFAHFYRTPPVGSVAQVEDGVYPPVLLYKRADVPLPDPAGARVGGRR